MFKQVRLHDAILKFYQRSQPIAFSNAETLYDDLVLLRDQILMYGDLSEAQTNYLNEFIEKFDNTLITTVRDIFLKWLDDEFLSDFLRDLVNEEVIDSRDGEANLNLRLIRDKQDLTNRIDEKRDKAIKLGQTDMTDEFLQQMAGTTPINSVPAKGSISVEYLKNNAVNMQKILGSKNINVLDITKVTDNTRIGSTGNLITVDNAYALSDYIPVLPNEQYTVPHGFPNTVGCYDANRVYISTIGSELSPYSFTIPTNTYYIRVNLRKSDTPLNEYMICVGSSMYPSYVSYGADIDWLRIKSRNIGGGEVKELNINDGAVSLSKVGQVERINLLNLATITDDTRLGSSNNIISDTNYFLSDFIPVMEGKKYTFSYSAGVTTVAQFDANKNYISSIGEMIQPYTYTTPIGVYYIRINCNKYIVPKDQFMVVPGDVYPPSYYPYGGEIGWLRLSERQLPSNSGNVLYGKRLGVAGDSITYGMRADVDPVTGWFKTHSALTAIKNNMIHFNYGVSGSCMTNVAAHSFSNTRYQEMDANLDYLTIWFGWNDGAYATLGTIDDTDNTTFYGAWNVVLPYLINKYPTTKIGLIVPYGSTAGMRQAVREVGDKWGIPYLDLYSNDVPLFFDRDTPVEQDIIDARRTTFLADGTHPNQVGYDYLATIYENFLRSL